MNLISIDRKRILYLLAAFVCGSLVLYFFYLQWVSWRNFFWQWTTQQNIKIGEWFIRDNEVDNSALGTILSQISFWNGMVKFEATPRSIDQLFQNISILINTDIFELLNWSNNPEKALSSHITHLEETLFTIRETEDSLSRSIQSYLDQSNRCLDDKRQGDQQYLQGIEQGNSEFANAWLSRSLDNAPCYITNRIQANAQLVLLQKTTAYVSLLQRRYQILSQNKERMLTHAEYLEGEILDELLILREQLRAINNPQVSETQRRYTPWSPVWGVSISSRWWSNTSRNFAYDLPMNEWFVIRPDHIPTFENPWLEMAGDTAERWRLDNPLSDNPRNPLTTPVFNQ